MFGQKERNLSAWHDSSWRFLISRNAGPAEHPAFLVYRTIDIHASNVRIKRAVPMYPLFFYEKVFAACGEKTCYIRCIHYNARSQEKFSHL